MDTVSNRPEPTHFRLLQGNPGRRPINENEPKPRVPRRAPPPPAFLGTEAKAEWRRVIRELLDLGLYTALDRSALAAYCQAWDQWLKAEAVLARAGRLVKTPTGYDRPSPFVAIASNAMKHLKAFLIEFGMTPASRSRVYGHTSVDDREMEDFLFGNRGRRPPKD